MDDDGVGWWLRLEGWLRWSAQPLGGAVCRDQAQHPVFAPSTSEVAVGFWSFCILLFLMCLNCTCTQLFLVSFSFFVFCCWQRCLSRWKHWNKGSQAPACLIPLWGILHLLLLRVKGPKVSLSLSYYYYYFFETSSCRAGTTDPSQTWRFCPWFPCDEVAIHPPGMSTIELTWVTKEKLDGPVGYSRTYIAGRGYSFYCLFEPLLEKPFVQIP